MAEKQDTDSPAQETAAVQEKAKAKPKRKPSGKPKPKLLPPYNVVLLDDNDHTYEYVIEMLGVVFKYPAIRGFQLAKEVDSTGRVIVFTSHKELAELKRDQILGYGADPRMQRSRGSMKAVIEPAEG